MASLLKLIKDLFDSLKNSGSFVQNFSYVAGGKLAVILISFITVPILARLFSPEAYGHFAIYNSVTLILTMIVLLGYPNSYVLIKSNEDFRSMALFQLMKVLVTASFILVVVSILGYLNPALPRIYYFIPFGLLINGFLLVFSNWNVREGLFKLSSQLEGFGGVGLRLTNVLIGWLGSGYVFGLILGELIGKGVVVGINASLLLKSNPLKINWNRLKKTLWEWRNYPKYVLPNNLISQFSGQLPIYILAIVFDQKILGYYSMAYTVFSMPIQLFANAIAPVYLKKASDIYEEGLTALKTFTTKLLSTVNALLIVPFLIVILSSEEIIYVFLGDQWGPTGFIVSVMAFPVFTELTLGPISSVLQVLRKEKSMLGLNILSAGLMTGASLLVLFVYFEFEDIIFLLIAVRLFSNLVKVFFIYKLLGISFWRYSISYLLI